MNLFPFDNYVLASHLTPSEIWNRVYGLVSQEGLFTSGQFGRDTSQCYKGSLDGSRFRLTRVINYKNSFAPVILGVIEENEQGCLITVKARLKTEILVITLFSSAFLVFFITSAFFFPILNRDYSSEFPGLLGLAFLYSLATICFHKENIKCRADLSQLFEI